MPSEHFSPGFASWHPWGKLNAQHRRSPALVWRALPIKPRGMFGPRPFLFLPPFPLPFALGGCSGRPHWHPGSCPLELVGQRVSVLASQAAMISMAMAEGGNSLQDGLTLC